MKETDSTLNLLVEKESRETLLIKLYGDARGKGELLSIGVVRAALDQTGVRLVAFDSAGVTGWDSRFVAFIATTLSDLTTQLTRDIAQSIRESRRSRDTVRTFSKELR